MKNILNQTWNLECFDSYSRKTKLVTVEHLKSFFSCMWSSNTLSVCKDDIPQW